MIEPHNLPNYHEFDHVREEAGRSIVQRALDLVELAADFGLVLTIESEGSTKGMGHGIMQVRARLARKVPD